MPVLINLAAFNLLWLLLVVAAYLGRDLIGLGALAVWLLIHFRYSRCPRSDLQLLLAALLAGPLTDTALLQAGLIHYAGSSPAPGLPPYWIYGLWANFAITLNHALRWLHHHPLLAAAAGAVTAPLAYAAGAKLGAAQLASPAWQPLLALALAWMLLLPALLQLAGDRPRRG